MIFNGKQMVAEIPIEVKAPKVNVGKPTALPVTPITPVANPTSLKAAST